MQSDLYLKAKGSYLSISWTKKKKMLQLKSDRKGKYTNATAVKIDQTYMSW